jgi:putative oligomerization/nucleic acid binding protein
MPLMRRRPLLRAAMVGGTAYYAGKHTERNQEHEEYQDAQLADAQQPAAAPPPPPQSIAAAPAPVDPVTALTQLKALLDGGVLTQAEFDAQKRRILEGS